MTVGTSQSTAAASPAVGLRRPDFFIVGAPKSGTTAMYEYLRQHPQIFMAGTKELNFFGADLERRRTPRLDEEAYLAYFADAGGASRVGEASVRYLHSRSAAAEIAAFAPGAQAIAMLREPVELLSSLHAELLFRGEEEIDELGAALAAEGDRRAGRRIPAATNLPAVLLYRETVRFAEQLERYRAALGSDRVHVILYDDFEADPQAAYQATLRFLGVDANFAPPFSVVNPRKRARSRLVQQTLANPPSWLRSAVRRTLPRGLRKRIFQRALRLNAVPEARPEVDPQLAAALRAEMAPDVERLGAMIGRDLTPWLSGQRVR